METIQQEECQILEALHEQGIVLGNGICDPELNIKSCNFDNGDCTDFNASFPQCPAAIPSKLGNGICDNFFPYNSKLCGYDGGDCLPVSKENNDSLIAALTLIVSIAILCLIFARKYHRRRIQEISDVSLSHSRHSIAIEDSQVAKEREMERKKHVIAKILITEVNANISQDKVTEHESSSLDSSTMEEEKSCPICYQCFITGEEIVKSLNKHCIHEYHKDCVLPWLLKSDECPMCRALFLDANTEEDV